jgi:hypothetical protein
MDPEEPFEDHDLDILPDTWDPSWVDADFDDDRFLDGYEAVHLDVPAIWLSSQVPSLGDVDGNRVLDNADSQLILNFFANQPTPGTAAEFSDLNRDGTIDNADAQHSISFFASLQPFLPIQ